MTGRVLLLDWKVLGPARAPSHDHSDAKLTIGCLGCIERVVVDQVVATLVAWYAQCDEEEATVALPERCPTPHRLRQAYQQLRDQGWPPEDVRGVLAMWCAEHE